MKRKSYFTILLLILAIGIGYATLSTTLSITGLSKFKKNSWGVHFVDIADNSFNKVDSVQGVISEDRKSIDFEVNFTTPGENYIFYTEVVNDGTIDAMFDNFNVQVAEEAKKLIDVQVTYLDGIEVSKYDLLEAGEKETFKVDISYSQNITVSDLPRDGDVDFTVTLSLNYVQSDSNAKVRTYGDQDEASPIISNLRVTPGEHSISVDITSYDEYSGIIKYYYSKDGGETYIPSNNPNYVFTSLADGDYNISVYTEDVSGNKSIASTATAMVSTIYAILYDDGTLALNNSGTIDDSKTLVKNYGNIAKISYNGARDLPWFSDNNYENITTVDIEERIKPYSTNSWFYYQRNLSQILHIENLDTSRVTDMSCMFVATKIASLDLKSWDTSNVINMSYMFSSMSSLITLDISTWNTSKVTEMSFMFQYDSNLENINFGTFNTPSVINMGSMFYYCSKLESLDISAWDTSNVEIMSNMFAGIGLTTLDIGNWDTSSVWDMSYMFWQDTNLSSLNISNWDVSSVTTMDNMFNWASSLSSLNLNNWDITNVYNVSQMFQGCTSLEELYITDWDVSNLYSISYMFAECYKLSNLDLSKWDTRNIDNFYDVFRETGRDATSKVVYYGVNSTNMFDARNNSNPLYMEFTYKSN